MIKHLPKRFAILLWLIELLLVVSPAPATAVTAVFGNVTVTLEATSI